jgi:hypothetical protein
MAISPSAPESIPDEVPCDLCNFMGPGIDWYRLLPGALGTYGIVTVMNVKVAHIPAQQKVLFFGFENLEDCIEPFYHIERKQIGDECFLLNSHYLASVLASDPDDIRQISSVLPPYTLILNLTAGEWFPEEKMAFQEEAIRQISRTFLLNPMESLPGIAEADKTVSSCIYQPCNNGTYWKFRAKGASQEVFFLTQLQRSPEFLKVVQDTASGCGYPLSDIGLYLQPKQWGKAFHMEVSFPYSPEDTAEKEMVKTVHKQVSEALVSKGAFFYRIYGPWTDMVYSRTGTLHETLKRIKRTLDPNGILNPGKLGF